MPHPRAAAPVVCAAAVAAAPASAAAWAVPSAMDTYAVRLARVALRYANQPGPAVREGHFEILSLTGTLDSLGGHLHLCVADSAGAATGGHLWDGCRIYTTAEIVIGEMKDVEFGREVDSTYGYRELVVQPRRAR